MLHFNLSNISTFLIILIFEIILRQKKLNNISFKTDWLQSYDYIVIGSGTGSVVASRLSEDPNISVLILESGGPPTVYSEMPSIHIASKIISEHPRYSWNYKIVSQKNAYFGLKDNKIGFAFGKVLGGNSGINTMQYNRGNPLDFDNWNTTGWSFLQVLPYFLKSENNTDDYIVNLNPSYHNQNGLLTISSAKSIDPFDIRIIKAANKAGYPLIDINGPTQNGIAIMQYMIKDGRRESTPTAFLLNKNIWKRKNLNIMTYSHVTKILFDTNRLTPKANQVEFYHNHKYYRVKANKEVILSAGGFGSPQLLMLSGIGPKNELKKFNIPVVVDLPAVGKNFQNHYNFELAYTTKNQSEFIRMPSFDINDLYEHFVEHKGPISHLSLLQLYLSTDLNIKFAIVSLC